MAIWHVTPTDDLEEHEENSTCDCEPRVDILENGDIMIVHNSYDGRELEEETKTGDRVS